MARVYREVVRDVDDDGLDYGPAGSATSMFANIVYLIGGVVLALLSLRFLLSLLGANTSNPFANFVYSTSAPFVRPFFGLFNYTPQFGVNRFEFETLIAIVVYSIVIALIARLVTMGRRSYY